MGFEGISRYRNYINGLPNGNIILLDKFIKEHEITQYDDTSRHPSLVLSHTKGRDSLNDDIPFRDHACYFKDKHGTIYYTIQPYRGVLDIFHTNDYIRAVTEANEMVTQIDAWCKKYNLKAHYYGASYSWYYKGRSSLIIITLPNVEVKYLNKIEV